MTANWQEQTCEGKQGFRTSGDAKKACRGKKFLKPYSCSVCGKWHLTSREGN